MILHKDTEQLDLIVISIFDMIELGGNFIQLHWNFFAQLGEEKLLLVVIPSPISVSHGIWTIPSHPNIWIESLATPLSYVGIPEETFDGVRVGLVILAWKHIQVTEDDIVICSPVLNILFMFAHLYEYITLLDVYSTLLLDIDCRSWTTLVEKTLIISGSMNRCTSLSISTFSLSARISEE